MVNAGASIEAFLRLDATEFNKGLESVSTTVTKFKESMLDVGKESATFTNGMNNVSQALTLLIDKIELLDTVDSKTVNKFKTMTSGLENIATAAQRLSVDVQRGSVGMESLSTVMEIFESGMASAEVVIKANTSSLRAYNNEVNRSRSGILQLSQEEQILRSQFQLLDSTISENVYRTEEVRALTQRLKNEYGLTGQKLIEVREQLLQTTQATVQYEQPLNMLVTRFETLKTGINGVKSMMVSVTEDFSRLGSTVSKVGTTFQSWRTLTDEIVNSTTQKLSTSVNKVNTSLKNLSTNLNSTTSGLSRFSSTLNSTDQTIARSVSYVQQYAHALTIPTKYMMEGGAEAQRYKLLQKGVNLTIEDNINTLRRQSAEMQRNAQEKLKNMGYTRQESVAEEQLSQSTTRTSTSLERQSASLDRTSSSMNRATTQTNRLKGALSSLRSIGTLVASMMVYNFAHSLITATRETVNAKSEMEGYFKMLHFGQNQIGNFNKALDETIARFPRINKYALGETISSIGVEFNLTTKEMEKAMPVVSMITSEYLRTGRNVNEASLAVKDILQGEFQRLSRETGVKGDQLREAGWSGDKNDVMGLLDALKKVGESRNWDVFVTKANSLNDAVLILQNRFSEWSAEMVNVVQPTILAVFNSLMSIGQGFAVGLTNIWQWLNADGWGQTAVKIGGVTTALLTLSQALVMYRTKMGLVQLSQMGLTKQLASLVLGLKGQEIAEVGVRNAILSKILGVKAETIANKGLVASMKEATLQTKANAIQEQFDTMRTGENTVAKKLNKLAMDLEKASTEGLISAKEKNIIQTQLDTLEQELNTVQKEEQIGANMGLTASLYYLGTGEIYVAETTGMVSTAMGILNGIFMLSPIGWITAAILAMAGAVYVLTGGLDDSWNKMKQFNETMQDTGTAQKDAYQWLEQVKNEVGEQSNKFKTAKGTVDDYVKSLKSASYWYNHSKEAFENQGLTLSSTSRDTLIHYGVSEEDVDTWVNNSEALSLGKYKYYHAEQVLNKQIKGENSNFSKDLKQYLADVDSINGDLEGAYSELRGNYENLAQHSYEANTADNWWDWAWASMYAGLDQFWIDSMKTQMDFTKWFDDLFSDISEDGIIKVINDRVLKPLQDAWNHLMEDPWGVLIEGSGKAEYKGTDPFTKYISSMFDLNSSDGGVDIVKLINEGLPKLLWGSDTNFTIGDIINDWWNTNIVEPLSTTNFDLLGTIINSIFPAPVSASDGTSDHPSFMEDVSDILGFDVQSWIDSFTSDPWSTLGVEFPSFDIIGTITSSFGSVNVADFIGKLILPNDGGIFQWVMDTIINPLVEGIKQGVENTPILGDVASLLGFGDGTAETQSKESGTVVGTNFTTGVQTGLGPLDGIINTAFKGLNLDDVTAKFQGNATTISSKASSTASEVGASFTTMKNNQRSSLDSMVSKNNTAFQNMQTSSNSSMIKMRDSTSSITSKMTDAWRLMKDNIVASAEKIKTDSKIRFDTLGQTISGFYRKIQNPSLWGGGAGHGTVPRRVARNPSVGKSLVSGVKTRGGYAGGLETKSSSATMSISQLKRELCPSGECDGLFDGYKSTDVVNVWDFLQSVGTGHGFGGWNFAQQHNAFIKNKSDAWDTAPPIIDLVGGISTNTGFKVNNFNNGTPKVTFSQFEDIATAIFSRIPYRFYYDSSWKGSWLGALQSGACNCYDGAMALMALARTFGFSASMAHGTWTDPSGKKTAHVWAMINGVKMDTTGLQQRGSWRPSASAGGNPNPSSSGKTVNITVDMSGATVYGVEDLDNRIQESVQKGLQSEFNDPYTVAI